MSKNNFGPTILAGVPLSTRQQCPRVSDFYKRENNCKALDEYLVDRRVSWCVP